MKRILILTGLLTSVGSGILLYQSRSSEQSQPVAQNTVTHQVDTEFKAEAKGHQQYLLDNLANPATGKIEVADVLRAREAVYKKAAEAKRNKMGSLLEWEELGPNNVGGRSRACLVDRNNSNRVYAGSVAGGLFISENGGQNWGHVVGGDTLAALAVGALAQAPNGDIYLGTGEGLINQFQNPGVGGAAVIGEGMWKSTDGLHFVHLENTRPTNSNNGNDGWAYVNSIAVDPNNSNLVYAATGGGMRVSTDAGDTWTMTQPGVGADVHVGSDGTAIAVISNSVYRSRDNGQSWENLTSNVPDLNGTLRMHVELAPTNPNYLYLLVTHNISVTNMNASPPESTSISTARNIYQSTDQGDSWTIIGHGLRSGAQIPNSFNPVGDQGWYNVCLAVSPHDHERIIVGGQLESWMWTQADGWQLLANAGDIHADHHFITFDPNDPDVVFVVGDGGVYKCENLTDPSPQFSEFNKNYNTIQFYGVGAGLNGVVIGGAQDNGTQYLDFSVNSKQAARHVNHSDGGYSEVSHINPEVLFSERQDGFVERSANNGEGWSSVWDCHIDCGDDTPGAPDGGAQFIHPYILWEEPVYDNEGNIDQINSFSRLFTPSGSGIWMGEGVATKLANSPFFRIGTVAGSVAVMTPSFDGNHLYVGTTNGAVYRISGLRNANFKYDDNDNWSASAEGVTTTLIDNVGERIKAIAVDPNSPGHVVVGSVRYGRSNYVFESTMADVAGPNGGNFVSIQGDLPPMPVWSLQIHMDNSNVIIAGTEMGIWATKDGGSTWFEENNGMARVPVHSLRQQPLYEQGCMVLYAGTHGRGVFRSTSLTRSTCKTTLGINDNKVAAKSIQGIQLYPNPMLDQAKLEIQLMQEGNAIVRIYDIQGKLMRTQQVPRMASGKQVITINKDNLPAGTYMVTVEAGYEVRSTKLVVL